MIERQRFVDAALALTAATEPHPDLSTPFVDAFHLSGAAVSTLGDPLGTETISASDPRAAQYDELQIDLAEGPCWQALDSRRAVSEPTLQDSTTTAWPLALAALQMTGLGALYALPLIVGSISVGAVSLYSMTPAVLSERQLLDAGLLAAIVARKVLHQALLVTEEALTDVDAAGSYSRREVHQATGMVLAQMKISAEDAHLVLRSHAFTTGRSILDIAADVIARDLDFTTPPPMTPRTEAF